MIRQNKRLSTPSLYTLHHGEASRRGHRGIEVGLAFPFVHRDIDILLGELDLQLLVFCCRNSTRM